MDQERAFRFFGSAKKNVQHVAASKTMTKSNVVFLAIDTAVEVIQAGISYVNLQYERQHTKDLEEELNHARIAQDEVYQEQLKQYQTKIHEAKERMKADLNQYKVELELESQRIRSELEHMRKSSDYDVEAYIKRLGINDRLRKPLLDALQYIAEMIDKEKEKGTDFRGLAKLQEEYRHAYARYNELIQVLV
ncbi:hypothetical protein N780_09555 [Pontibacillus chungwhensis BH030062]|uniref:Uncharacterized protein n=1 Tax=Pontibacillus chungwhensis BH030062 TaxID=1385513 RepID=A0A0A2V861_9BACI|nr:hypothetical protein [Pontibacillus chungwhensis]KGP89880.1 hypothetical protein N780_09555 [Pontibacillus chungwhensis BH030062]